jgi:hypothetical protein
VSFPLKFTSTVLKKTKNFHLFILNKKRKGLVLKQRKNRVGPIQPAIDETSTQFLPFFASSIRKTKNNKKLRFNF